MRIKTAVLAAIGAAALIAGVFFLWRGIDARLDGRAPVTERIEASETAAPVTAAPEDFPAEEAEAAAEASETAETAPTPTPEPYISPIDFASLQAANPDIYAWLELEGTDISYPVVQHPTNDTYYLNHNSDGKYAARGAIFSENYNSGDLSDPVTLLYGHHMQSGAMFGELQQYYSGAAFFAEHSLLILYTPGEERDYTIFAAVPWSGEHLLREYDFSDPAVFAAFFAKVAMTRSLSANFRKEAFPEAGDQVVILSTCLQGNNTQRYLVMAARSGGS